jgi:hypothetical protein
MSMVNIKAADSKCWQEREAIGIHTLLVGMQNNVTTLENFC